MLPDIDWSRGWAHNANVYRVDGKVLEMVYFLVKLGMMGICEVQNSLLPQPRFN